MKKINIASLLFLIFMLGGCAALSAGWNDEQIRTSSQLQGTRFREFVSATTGNAWAGMAAGAVGGFAVLLILGLKKKKTNQ